MNNQGLSLESTQHEEAKYHHRAKKYCSTMIYRDSDSKKPREVKDILDFPTSSIAHIERAQKENDYHLVKVYVSSTRSETRVLNT